MASVSESLTQQETANRLRITTAWVRELTKRGVLSRNEDGSYPWPKVADEYETLRRRPDDDAEQSGYKSELSRLTRQKADAQEMENAVRRGELVPVAEMQALVRATLESGNRALKQAPRKLAKRWAKKLKVPEAQAIELIEQIVEDVRAILREAGEGNDAAAA